VRTINIYNAI